MTTARTIARNASAQAAADVLGKVASLAFYVVMARKLGKEGFGDFTFALSLAQLLVVFAGFGVDQAVTRTVAREPGAAPRMLVDGLAVKVVFGLLAILAAVAVSFIGGYPADVRGAVALLAIAAVVEIASKVFYATFQGLDDMRPIAASLVLQRYVTAAAGVAALLAGADVVVVSAIYLGGALVAFAFASRRLAARAVRPRGRASRERVRGLVRGTFAIGVTTIFNTALFRVDALLLSLIKGNAAVGLYGVAYRLLESTLFLSYGFVAALLPTLSRVSRDSRPSIGEATELGLKLIAAMLVPLGACFALFAHPIVHLIYSDRFDGAITPLRLLGGEVALYGVSYLAAYVLIAQGRQRVLPIVTAAVLGFNLVANLVVIPIWSYNGAAAVTSASEILLSTGLMAFVLKVTGRLSALRICAGPLAGCAALVAVALAAGTGLTGLVIAPFAYVVVLAVVERGLFPADVRSLIRVVRGRSPLTDVAR